MKQPEVKNRPFNNSCMAETTLQDYVQRVIKNEGQQRTPFSGNLDLTYRCNNRCVQCFVNKPEDDNKEIEKELTYSEICRILDQLAEEGCLWLLMTGGEPLLREDWIYIYLYAKKKGFLVTLFTNGTLISPSVADILQEFPPLSIEVTLYGITERTYERVTRAVGSFEKCMNGINLLVERKLPVKLKTVVITLNKHEFVGMKKFAKDMGLEFRFDAIMNERIDRHNNVARLRIPPSEVVELDLTDPRRAPEYVSLYERASGMRLDPELLFHCGAGMNSFNIDPYGGLMACIMTRNPSYDLRTGSFKEGWRSFLPRIREQKAKKKNKCKDCGLNPICDQCPGWSQLETGDQETPVEYLCQVAHLRAEAFGIERHGG